jgi:HSP20 family protein
MDLVDDPSSPNIIAIFELPGIKNENITLQIKDRRLIVVGNRVDPYAEALASAVASDAPESETQPHSASNTAEILTKPGVHITAVGNDPGGSITPSKNKSVRELRYGLFFRCISVPEGIKV